MIAQRSMANVPGATVLIAVTGWAAAMLVAFLNQPYFALVNGFVHAEGSVAQGLLFSSWLLLIGGLVVVWDPPRFGLRLGDTRREWRLVIWVTVLGALLTFVALLGFGGTPYSDANAWNEMIVVPVTEELVFRAALFTLLLAAFAALHPLRTAVVLAIAVDAVGFGTAHLANATNLQLTFVLPQVVFATLLGAGCAYLMYRTRSLLPAILLHAAVNGVVVAM